MREVHREPQAASWELSVPCFPPGAALRGGQSLRAGCSALLLASWRQPGAPFPLRWGAEPSLSPRPRRRTVTTWDASQSAGQTHEGVSLDLRDQNLDSLGVLFIPRTVSQPRPPKCFSLCRVCRAD